MIIQPSDMPDHWVVDMAELFRGTEYHLNREDIEILVGWLDGVCGGFSERADDLRLGMEEGAT